MEARKFARLLAFAGTDFHVLVTLLHRGWGVLAGGATVLLLPLGLSPVEQGYYYTFGSVLALQVFFELGLGQVVMQLVSHEAAHLRWTSDGHLHGDERHMSRLSAIARLMRWWYAIAAALFAVVGGLCGALFFSQKGTLPHAQWLGVWVVLICCTAANLSFSPALATLEGCGKVGQVARLRLVQSMLGYIALWVMLLGGAGLWAVVCVPAASMLSTGLWLRSSGRLVGWLVREPPSQNHSIDWRKEVLPLQWRIAVSFVSGYFILNLFTPLAFSRYGAVEAGRLGIALTIFSAVLTIGMSWINAKAPSFSQLISLGARQQLKTLFRSTALRSTIATTALCVAVVGLAWILSGLHVPLMARIAEPAVLACIAVVTIVNSAVFAAAAYMRAHREEPMLPISVVSAVLTIIGAYVGSHYGVLVMMMSYATVTLLVTLPWTARLFAQYYARSK